MQSEYILLNNGLRWPILGFGTWKIPDGDAVIAAITEALDVGYKLIDTAALYGNEAGIGAALKDTKVPREDYRVATKVWNSDQGFDATLKAFDISQKKLGLDYIDAYLIHWPMPEADRYLDTWRAFERLYHEGRVKAIGVSNFEIPHLERLLEHAAIAPMFNQVECHLGLQQVPMLNFCQQHGIVMQGWRTLGNGTFDQHPLLLALGKQYAKTPAQITLRYFIQQGINIFPKTVNRARMLENISLFNFVLTDADMAELKKLEGTCGRFGFDPNHYHDEVYSRG